MIYIVSFSLFIVVLLILAFFFRHWLRVLFLLPSVLVYRARHKPARRLFGVRAYVGAVGQGKTISMVREAMSIRKTFPNVKIYSNMAVDWAIPITTFKNLCKIFDSDDPALIVWDEVGVNLNSRDWAMTPTEFISLLAQNRKGAGTRLLYTAQSYDMVDKQLRTLTNEVVLCRTFFEQITLNYMGCHVNVKDGTAKKGLPCQVFNNLKFRKDYDTYETCKKIARSYLDH